MWKQTFTRKSRNAFKGFWLTDVHTHDMNITKFIYLFIYLFATNTNISHILKALCLINSQIGILSYLNVNWIWNTFDNLSWIIKQNVDMLAVSDTKT